MKRVLLVIGILLANFTNAQSFEAGEKVFKQNCAACHKMDKKVVGPALQNVVADQGAEWVYEWVKNNQALRESGDAHANEVYNEFNQGVMPAYEWLGDESLNDVVQYLADWKGKQEAAAPVAVLAGPAPMQQAPYEMPVWLKIMAGVVVLFAVLTAFMGVHTSRTVARAYVNNQVTTTYLLKKQDLTTEDINDEFDSFVEEEVMKRVDQKVKILKKDLNSKLKNFS